MQRCPLCDILKSMKKPSIWLLVGILAIGAFLRFYLITEVPLGLYPDEAMNGNNALEALATGNFSFFYPENNGREGLFINIQALSVVLFGNTPWALRVVSALFGTLTILGVYLAAKELFRDINDQSPNQNTEKIPNTQSSTAAPGTRSWMFFPALKQMSLLQGGLSIGISRGEYIAIFSSFFLAVSYWHVNFSRIGFRAIMVPFFAAFAVYFLLKGLRRGNATNLVLAGICTGLGLHTYIAFRLMAPVIAVPLAWSLWQWRKKSTTYLPDGQTGKLQPTTSSCAPCAVALFAFIVFVIALPLVIHFAQHPQDFSGRANGVSVFAAAAPLKEFARSAILTARMLFWGGDCNWRHNFNCQPQLNPIIALFLLIDAVSLLKSHFNRDFNRETKTLLAVWAGCMALPAILTRESIPHALRSIGMIPPLMILAGLGADRARLGLGAWIARQQAQYPQHAGQISRIRYELFAFFIIALLLVPLMTYRTYFLHWSNHPKTYEAFDTSVYHMGQFLAGLPPDTKKYVVVNTRGVDVRGIPMSSQAVMFVTDSFTPDKQGEKNIRYLPVEPGTAPDRAAITSSDKTVISFIDGGDIAGITSLQAMLPDFHIQVPGDFVVLQNF